MIQQQVAAPRRSTTLVEFVAVTLIWGSTWLVIKGQLGTVPAAWSVAYRFIIAGTALFVYCLATGRWRWPGRRVHGFAALAGLAQFMLNFNLVYAAEARLTSGLVSLIFALLIVPNAVFARIFLGVPITRRFVAGATLGIAGLALVFAPDLIRPGAGAAVGWGLALVVAAVVSASVANVMQAGAFARALPPLPTLATIMAYGAGFDIAWALATAGPPVFDPRPEYWLGLTYLALVASVVAFTLYYRLIRRIGPGPAAYSSVVVPVVAMALSTLFEGYRWNLPAGAGAALALTGLAVALDRRRP